MPLRAMLLLVLLIPQVAVAQPSPADVEFFEARVRPLLIKHCSECHSRQAKTVQGGLRLDHPDGLKRGGESGPAVVPGKPDESRLIAAVRYKNPDSQMPPAGKLTDVEIEVLVAWVQRGAAFPTSASDGDPSKAVPKRTIDIAAGKTYWAFQPLARTALPVAPEALEHAQPLDAFVISALSQQGLAPSPRADRRTLLRRVSFDLLGLPPTPEELADFEADASPDAYERLVERLLASPHYGERWGRFWLDLVRYADVLESWAPTGGHAWPYRDWVVTSLNDDVPYDRFVKLQLAADQMPDAPPTDIAALGFLGLSPSYWKELKLAPDVIKTVVAEEWEERINTVSGTFLGLTVACARCHDHKFDPVTQRDYYGLAGIFASIRQTPRPMLSAEVAQQVSLARGAVQKLDAEAANVLKQAAGDATKADALKQQVESLKARAAELKAKTPHYDDSLVLGIEDASLFVLPDGANRTKLDFKVGAGQDVAMQMRGNPAQVGEVVQRRFLSVLSADEPRPFAIGSGRAELGQAIFRDATPLAARVFVNRVWRHHFGKGLVETPSNFGSLGSKPSHPELLDDLAGRFVAAGWSLKWLQREIVLSATYQQVSTTTDRLRAVDPDNIWLGRMSRRRLEVEAWRDSMLAVAGQLDVRFGGAPTELSETSHARRTLYGTIKRRELNDLLRLYDFPDPTSHSPARFETTTPLQQLYVLNSNFMARQAAALIARVRREQPGEVTLQVSRAYELLFGRSPSAAQLARSTEFLTSAPSDERWQQFAEVLLSTNAMQFVD